MIAHGHTAFEEYRYDALGRRIWTRVRRWCDDQGAGDYGDDAACEVSTVRRTVWSGAQELAEIQMPAFDSTYLNPVRTPSDTVENDTLPLHRRRNALMPGDPFYDANRLYGRVLYVMGLATDEPLAITRMNYADASSDSSGAVAWAEYAPYSILPLWNDEGRTDRAVMGGTAAPGQDLLCADVNDGRCAYVGFDRGEFPFARSGSYSGVWQGTLLIDKADATGTYYRRNQSYDPNTARFTQEDPLGLGGGLNVYGFAGGDPVSYADPYGLCKVDLRYSKVAVGYHAYVTTTQSNSTSAQTTSAFRGGPTTGASDGILSGASSGAVSQKSGRNSNSSNSTSPGAGRGGPGGKSGPWGPIHTVSGTYDNTFTDYPKHGEPPQVTQTVVDDKKDCKEYEDSSTETLDEIEAKKIPYNPLTPNSNAVAYTMLENAGITGVRASVTVIGFGLNLAP